MSGFIQSTFMDGYAGGPHIEETQVRQANQASFGPDDYVLEGGREAEAQILTNNSIRIFDAIYCIQGGRDVISANDYTDVTIMNGAQGVNRNDIIVRRYQKDESSEIESMEYAVIKGTPTSGTAADPEVVVGDIRNGATLHEMKLYRVRIEGLNIVAVEPLFKVLYNKKTIQDKIAELNSNCAKLPDYEHMENISHGYVAKRPGYVFVGGRASVDRFMRISINGAARARTFARASTSSSGVTYSQMVIVRPGDVVDYNLDVTSAGGQTYASNANFIPFM